MSDIELRDIEPTDVEEGPSKLTESQPYTATQSSTRREENPFANRPLPPLPRLAAENTLTHSAEVENQNNEDTEIPYYVEFLEFVDRPIMLEAHVHEPPRPSPNPSLSTAQTYHTIREVAEHPLRSNPHVPVSNHSSNSSDIDYSVYNSTRQEEESIYCDNLYYFPDTDSEASENLYDFHSSNLLDISEPQQPQHLQQQQQRHQQHLQHQQWTENEQFLFYTIICFLTLSVLHFLRTQC